MSCDGNNPFLLMQMFQLIAVYVFLMSDVLMGICVVRHVVGVCNGLVFLCVD